eukprot:2217468-Amphidinium_carterae.2
MPAVLPHHSGLESIVIDGEDGTLVGLVIRDLVATAGSAGNLYIGNLAILSTARDTLRLCQSNDELQRSWNEWH